MIVRDPQSGKYYMAADEMANHCGEFRSVLLACTLVDQLVTSLILQLATQAWAPGDRTRAVSLLRPTSSLARISVSQS